MKIPNAVTLGILSYCYHSNFVMDEATPQDSVTYAVNFLLENGLVTKVEGTAFTGCDWYTTSEKGDFFVEQLLQMSLPEARQVWVIPT